MKNNKETYQGHFTNENDCWCNPTIEIMANGVKVIIHRNIDQSDIFKKALLIITKSGPQISDQINWKHKFQDLLIQYETIQKIAEDVLGGSYDAISDERTA